MIDNLAARHISDADPQEEIHRLIRFEGTFEEFLCKWLSAVCHCASASQAAVLDRDETHGNIVAKAIFPSTEVGGGMPFWLQQFAAQLGRNADWPAECSIHDIPVPGGFYGQTQKVFAYPLGIDGTKLIAAFLISGECDSKRLAAITAPFTCLINNYVAGRKVSVQENSLRRFRKLFELQSSLRHHARFGPLAMAICNEIATAAGAERVSLGVLGGHFVKCMAMSHTEKLNRKMKVVRQVEQAMEECLDQQQVVIYPAGDGDRAVTRMAEELSRHHGSGQIIAIPITPADEPKIVILMEFTDRRNDLKELLEITGAICEVEAARLYEFYLHSCWFGIRIAREIKKFAAIVVGAKHTWLKLAAIAIICVLFWAVFFRGDYEIESPVVLEAVQRRVVAAPFECYLVEADVQP
ncbi:MAG TPA: hypothetical protein PKK48_08315, partial [Phycisphaerae bacterium]|nr:hypothetical protein [Phycisphaerae bacterium]